METKYAEYTARISKLLAGPNANIFALRDLLRQPPTAKDEANDDDEEVDDGETDDLGVAPGYESDPWESGSDESDSE
jgi:hypothetical protein